MLSWYEGQLTEARVKGKKGRGEKVLSLVCGAWCRWYVRLWEGKAGINWKERKPIVLTGKHSQQACETQGKKNPGGKGGSEHETQKEL